MNRAIIVLVALFSAQQALSAQQDITQISGVQSSIGALKTQVNPRLDAAQNNFNDLYTNKVATSCFGSSAALAACFPELTLGGGVTSYNNLTDKPIIPDELADLATDTANQRVSTSEKSTWNAKQNALGYTPENTSSKGLANGYAGLGSDGRVPSSQLPPSTGTDDQTAAEVPATAWGSYTGTNVQALMQEVDTALRALIGGAALPTWMPSVGPTNGRQILQATGGCTFSVYDNQADCETNSGTWTTPTYQHTSIISGLINDVGTGVDDLLSASEINARIATSANTRQPADADLTKDAVVFVVDGGGSVITTGIKADLEIPWNATITSSTLVCDQSGSIVLDLWRDTYANYPATVADTITASAKPSLSTATNAQDTTLTGWTTALTAGDILRINVESAATVTLCTLSLQVVK